MLPRVSRDPGVAIWHPIKVQVFQMWKNPGAPRDHPGTSIGQFAGSWGDDFASSKTQGNTIIFDTCSRYSEKGRKLRSLLLRYAVTQLDVLSVLAVCAFLRCSRFLFTYAKLYQTSWTPNCILFAELEISKIRLLRWHRNTPNRFTFSFVQNTMSNSPLFSNI